jgi:uncharacterized membrane protein
MSQDHQPSDERPSSIDPTSDGPGIDRTITLTDAVVAIAMTLLVLPLVEISGDLDPANLSGFWADNRDLLMSFAISFVVIYAFWTGHGAIFRLLTRSGADDVPGMSTLNMFWLLLIAFLPFPTAMIGGDLTTTSTVLYLGTMLVVSALMVAMSRLAHRAAGVQTRHVGCG